MSRDDYWVDKIRGDYWCVYHTSMEKPITCFPKKKQATAFLEKEIRKHCGNLANESGEEAATKTRKVLVLGL